MSDNSLDREPIWHPDAEQAVLGAVLQAPKLMERLDLDATDFYQPEHEAVWAAIVACMADTGTADTVAVRARLAASGDDLKALGGPTALFDMVGHASTGGDVDVHAELIRDAATARRAIQALGQATLAIQEGTDPGTALAAITADAPTDRRGITAEIVMPDDVKIERAKWLKADWYPRDVVTIVAGRGGIGKSTLIEADLAAGTRGELEGDYKGRKVRSMLLAPEDSRSLTTQRMDAAGADRSQWSFMRFYRRIAGTKVEVTPSVPKDLAAVRDKLTAFNADVFLIDPLSSVVLGDLNKLDVARAGIDPLAALARELGISIIAVMHFNKGGGAAGDKVSGSHGFTDAARSVLIVAHDKDSGRNVVTVSKSNYSQAVGQSWYWHIEDTKQLDDNGELSPIGRAIIDGDADIDVEQVINRALSDEDEQATIDEATEWLTDYLTAEPGADRADVMKEARKALGCSESTVRRASKRLGVASMSKGFPRRATWSLPDPKNVAIPTVGSPVGSRVETQGGEHTGEPTGVSGVKQLISGPDFSQSVQGHGAEPTGEIGAVSVVTEPTLLMLPLDTPIAGLDPDWLMFPDSTQCRACGNDLLNEASKTSRCKMWHLKAQGLAA